MKNWILAAIATASFLLCIGAFVYASSSRAVESSLPRWINYQGRLTTPLGLAVNDGQYNAAFRIFDSPTTGTQLWSETAQVTAIDGVFNTTLGQTTAFPANLFSQRLWLETEIEGKTLTPRQELGAVAFAMTAISLPDGTVSSAMLEDSAVTANKIADGAVTEPKLEDDSVSSSKIQDFAVTGSKIAIGSVTMDKIAEEEWFSWTPSWTNLTLGGGTVVAKYATVGKTVLLRIKVTFASDTDVTGNVSFATPFVIDPEITDFMTVGSLRIRDSGIATYLGTIETNGQPNTLMLRVGQAAGTYLKTATLASDVPMNWALGDTIAAVVVYERT